MLGIQRSDDGFAGFLFEAEAGFFGNVAATAGNVHVVVESGWILCFGNFFGGEFGKHIQHQFLVGHVVAEVFFFQPFELFVFFGGFACPRLVNDVGERGEVFAFLQSVAFPLVGEVLADFDKVLGDGNVCQTYFTIFGG